MSVRESFVENWFHSWVKGVVQKCVARGKRQPSAAAKMVRTVLSKGFVSKEALSRILSDVERVTVTPFAKSPSYKERRERLERLKSLLM